MHNHILVITQLTTVLMTIFLSGSLLQASEEKTSQTVFYAEDIKEAMSRHLVETVNQEGIFDIHDEITKEDLELVFLQIHDPVRQIGEDVYFACTDFKVKNNEEKVYDIDFWLREENGYLKVFQTKIHKEPRNSLIYGWYKHPRYTFVNDEIEYLYNQ